MKNDIATIEKRETADKTLSDKRNRNDQLTEERRYYADVCETPDRALIDSRNRKDELTGDRRFNADKTMWNNRVKNDEMTFNRRETTDGNWNIAPMVN